MVNDSVPPIVWAPGAKASLRKAYYKIQEDSPANAEKVRDAIIKMIGDLPLSPTRYPLDRFKVNNPGNYRAFEKYN